VLKPSVPKTVRIATKDTFVGELNQTEIRYDLTPSRISVRNDDVIGPRSNSAQFLLLSQSGQCGI
jgi:hypothetical protein